MLRPRRAAALLPLIGLCSQLAACDRAPREIVLTGAAMGTTWTLRVMPAGRGLEAQDLRRLAEAALEEVDESMSTYRPDSAVSRFNASDSTDWLDVPQPLAAVAAESHRIHALSGGAFDITVAPMVRLWGFGPAEPRSDPPTDESVSAALAACGASNLEVRLDPPALRKRLPRLTLDLDAVAPGYAVDLLAERIEAAGLVDYMIEIGGEVRVRGRNARREPWRIGVERPEESGRVVAQVLHLESMAVSTSGDYRDYFESGGRRYSHTIDPRTGRPVQHDLASVTVLRPTALEADGLSTALMVLGPEAGFELAERMGWAVLFVERRASGFAQRETTAFARAAEAGESVP
jgi:thiamine biosynthesis lipoprotein